MLEVLLTIQYIGIFLLVAEPDIRPDAKGKIFHMRQWSIKKGYKDYELY